MSLGGPAGRGAPAAPPPPHLLSLPDDALLRVFAHLETSEKLALCGDPCDATHFAAAHPRIGRLHRRAVVTQLEVGVDCSGDRRTREKVERDLAQRVQQALFCYRRTETLHLRVEASPGGRTGRGGGPAPAPVSVESFLGAQLRDVKVSSVKLCWGSFRELLRACPRLLVLIMQECTWTREGGRRDQLAGAELRTWSRLERLKLWDSSGIVLRLVFNLTFFELHALRELDIYSAQGEMLLEGPVFDASATLAKITILGLACTSFSSADATRVLPRLRSLQELDVSFSDAAVATNPALWGVLPPSLLVVRAGGTRQLQDALGNGLTGRCGGPGSALRVLDIHQSGLNTWEALSRGVRTLRELILDDSTTLGDEGVEDALAAMPHLEQLSLCSCVCVGDRTAAAIARHPSLSSISSSGTAFSDSGMAELRRTFKPSGIPLSYTKWNRRR